MQRFSKEANKLNSNFIWNSIYYSKTRKLTEARRYLVISISFAMGEPPFSFYYEKTMYE